MNSRERIKTILNKQVPDRIGLYEHYWPEIKDVWASQGYDPNIRKEIYFDYDIMFCGGWINTEFIPKQMLIQEETDQWQVYKNGYGATVKYFKQRSGVPEHIGFEVCSRQAWNRYKDRLFELDTARFNNVEDIKKELESARELNKFSVFANLYIFELMRAIIGEEYFLPAMAIEPDWIEDFGRTYLNFFITHYEKLFSLVGKPDGFWVYEDMGYKNGLFCSPKMLSELVTPYHKKFVSFLKDHGIQVLIHSCGNVTQAVPLIIEAGFDCLQPMEAKAGMNVVQLARDFKGRISFMGNIDVVKLSTNDKSVIKEEIDAKVKPLIEMQVPYVFHSDHSLPPSINFETYQYAVQLCRQNGTY